ncbi:hypothetical protein TRIUR3_30568 [Triticum urartu]|uniref:Uncharacterized protein n=1 Tax=Triticum urartu TaxID=4572 RepID=M7ZP00_TRIUA|nr:hypothetical protein TRIUR3_30568 [Triticum urartu]
MVPCPTSSPAPTPSFGCSCLQLRPGRNRASSSSSPRRSSARGEELLEHLRPAPGVLCAQQEPQHRSSYTREHHYLRRVSASVSGDLDLPYDSPLHRAAVARPLRMTLCLTPGALSDLLSNNVDGHVIHFRDETARIAKPCAKDKPRSLAGDTDTKHTSAARSMGETQKENNIKEPGVMGVKAADSLENFELLQTADASNKTTAQLTQGTTGNGMKALDSAGESMQSGQVFSPRGDESKELDFPATLQDVPCDKQTSAAQSTCETAKKNNIEESGAKRVKAEDNLEKFELPRTADASNETTAQSTHQETSGNGMSAAQSTAADSLENSELPWTADASNEMTAQSSSRN